MKEEFISKSFSEKSLETIRQANEIIAIETDHRRKLSKIAVNL